MQEHFDESPKMGDADKYPELADFNGFKPSDLDAVTDGSDTFSSLHTRVPVITHDQLKSPVTGSIRVFDGVLVTDDFSFGRGRNTRWDITLDLSPIILGERTATEEPTKSDEQIEYELFAASEREFLTDPFRAVEIDEVPDYPAPGVPTVTEHEGNRKISTEKYTKRMSIGNMIRERSTYEYGNELGIDFKELARDGLIENGEFVWYDLCCGDFNAGRDVSAYTHGLAKCVGVDIDTLLDSDIQKVTKNCWILRGDAVTFPIPQDASLVTCHKGLRYIEILYGRDVMLGTVHRLIDELPAGARLVAEVTEDAEFSRGFPPYLVKEFGESVLSYRQGGCLVLDYTKPTENIERQIEA